MVGGRKQTLPDGGGGSPVNPLSIGNGVSIDSSGKSPLDERWYIILAQVIFPFIIAGFGMVCAGVVLDNVQVTKKNIAVL